MTYFTISVAHEGTAYFVIAPQRRGRGYQRRLFTNRGDEAWTLPTWKRADRELAMLRRRYPNNDSLLKAEVNESL